MDPIPDDLLKLKVRFDQWRVTRESRSEPVRRSNWPMVESESTCCTGCLRSRILLSKPTQNIEAITRRIW